QILVEAQILNEYTLDYGDDAPFENTNTLLWNNNLIGSILDFQENLGQVNFTDRLSEITIPSLVLWGKYDHSVPLEFAYEAFENLGSIDKDLVIFEKSGHCPHLSEPDLFGKKVIEFINSH
ncbi:MAG: alpha/beta fold hydrolase, partial [Saprospiraceae bacterium]